MSLASKFKFKAGDCFANGDPFYNDVSLCKVVALNPGTDSYEVLYGSTESCDSQGFAPQPTVQWNKSATQVDLKKFEKEIDSGKGWAPYQPNGFTR